MQRFEALDKQGYLGQAEPKEDAQQADAEEQLPSLPNFVQSLPGEKVLSFLPRAGDDHQRLIS